MSDQADSASRSVPPLFSGLPMHDYFCRMAELGASTTRPPLPDPEPWEEGDPFDLPGTYPFGGEQRSTEDFFIETDTAALLLLQDGKLRYERYALTGGRDVPWLSMSVAKSFISALVGIALSEGSIRSIEQPISDYFAVTPGSAYDGVSIRNVLQMSSGARWNEDYNDPGSDIFRLSAALGGGSTFDQFVATSVAESEPGTVCRYNSADTQALASLLVGATGRGVGDYMYERLLAPLGVVSPSHWLIDRVGREAAAFGLNMTARDYARLGELYRNQGRWGTKQLVPAEYVAGSIRVAAPHTEPGKVWISDHTTTEGYGYQWWLPEVDPGEFSAIGVYNQFVYVHPESSAVLVKLSANRHYGTSTEERTNRDEENLAFLRAIARSLVRR